MAGKQDYLKECNEFKVPVGDFEAQFCARCLQPECGRSQHGSSRFESRVRDWEKRLFLDVPRMDPNDPQFTQFQSKKFLDVGSVQGWVSPQDIPQDAPEEPDDLPELELVETVPTDPAPPPSGMPEPPPESMDSAPDTQPVPSTIPAPPGLMNTPTRSKMMLGGKKVDTKPSQPVFDQWEPMKGGETDGLQVVKPGAKIRLG